MKDRFENQEKDIEELLGRLKENPVVPSPAASGRIKAAMLEEARRMREQRLPWWRRIAISTPRFEVGKLMAAAAYTAGIALVILSVLWFANMNAEPALAQLQAEQGTVEVEHQVELIADLHYTYKKTVPAGKKIVLSPGDKIVVPDGAIGNLYFANGNKTIIGGDTELLLTSEDESQIALTLRLSKGEIKNYVKHDDKGFSVQTPIATATVSGTIFRVGVGDDDHTFLATDEGSVNVSVDGREINVKAGQEMEVVKENGLEIEVRPQPPKVYIASRGQVASCDRVLYSKDRRADIIAKTFPGAKVSIFENGEMVNYTWADEHGVARYWVVARAEGKYTFRLKTTMPGRESSRFSDAVTFVYDRTPPPLRILAPTSPIVVKSPVKIVGETEPGASVTVNGEPVHVDAAGRFTITLKLNPGRTPLKIESIDRAGNKLEDQLALEMQ